LNEIYRLILQTAAVCGTIKTEYFAIRICQSRADPSDAEMTRCAAAVKHRMMEDENSLFFCTA
jgi:hypothetical protein